MVEQGEAISYKAGNGLAALKLCRIQQEQAIVGCYEPKAFKKNFIVTLLLKEVHTAKGLGLENRKWSIMTRLKSVGAPAHPTAETKNHPLPMASSRFFIFTSLSVQEKVIFNATLYQLLLLFSRGIFRIISHWINYIIKWNWYKL